MRPAIHTPISAETYARFLPGILIRRHRLDPAVPLESRAIPVHGAILMADIIGYTALTERYSLRPEGVEQLKTLLNDYFGRLNSVIHAYGGDIISFAGDAVFAVWSVAEAGEVHEMRAVALAAKCALEAQRQLDRNDRGENLRMRIVVAAGDMTIAIVGGHAGKWECLATGAPLHRIGAGLAQTEPGAVVIDPQTKLVLSSACRVTALSDDYALLQQIGTAVPLPTPDAQAPNDEAIAALRCYIAKPVIEQLDAGHTEWLAEFRRATMAFVCVRGIEHESPHALSQLDAATRTVQAAVARYEGTFHRVIVDDKGTNMLCVWGIPGRSHEDDAARALAAALAMQNDLRSLGHECGIGITTGRVMCGLSGGGPRYEYTVAGDAVNFAARLMVLSNDGVLCDAMTAEAARGGFDCEPLEAVRVKGREAAIPVFKLVAAIAVPAVNVRQTESGFFGRRNEVARLKEYLDALRHGRGAAITIEGEPGIGKSQLVAELERLARVAGTAFLLGHADAIEHNTTYFIWREILRQIFAQMRVQDAAELRSQLDALCADAPAVRAWLPLLNDVLPLGFAETAMVRHMNEQARAEGTLELLLHILHRTVAAQPLVIVLEDAHWMDSMSWMLAARLHRRVVSVLLVLVTRSGHAPAVEEGRELLQDAAAQRIDLATFSREDTAALVCDRLHTAAIPEELLSLIYARTDGHPLFSEELAYALRDTGFVTVHEGACLLAGEDARVAAGDLPATVEGIIAGRVDRLLAAEQLTLKIASIFGRVFSARALCDIHPMHPDAVQIARQLESFVALDLVHAQPSSAEVDYLFKHSLTQEVTYGLLAFAQRRELHRAAAGWIERAHAADVSVAYPLLAHHWSRAGDPPQAFRFLQLAGEQAFKRHANREAAGFLQEALAQNISPEQKPAALVRSNCERVLGFSWLWLGDIARSAPHIRNSLALLGHRMPESRLEIAAGIVWQLALGVRNHFLRRRFIQDGDTQLAARADMVESLIRYSHIAWFRSDIALTSYISLLTLNLAERMQMSAATALVYSALTSAAGAVPLHGLARRYRDLALEGAQLVDDPGISSQVLLFVTLYQGGLGDWAGCLERVMQAEALARGIGDFRRAEECRVIAGYLHMQSGDVTAALRDYAAAEKSARRRGDRQTTGWGFLGKARAMLALGRHEVALHALGEAAPLITESLGNIELHGMNALAFLRARQFEQSWRFAQSGLRLLRDSRPVSFTTLTGTSGIAESIIALWVHARGGGVAVDRVDVLKREAQRALGLLRRFARIYPVGMPRRHFLQGNYWLADGKVHKALSCWEAGAAAAAALGMPLDEALACLKIARHGEGTSATLAHARAAALFETLGVPEPADSEIG